MNSVDRLTSANAEGKISLVKKRKAVLFEVSRRTGGLPERMPVYMDTIEEFVAFLVPFSLGANDGHFVAGLNQCLGFLPYPTIKRDRQILDQDQNVMVARNGSLPRVENTSRLDDTVPPPRRSSYQTG